MNVQKCKRVQIYKVSLMVQEEQGWRTAAWVRFPGVTCGLSLLLVLVLAQRIHVSPSLLVFLPPQKTKQTNKQAKNKKTIQIRPGSRGQGEPPRGMAAAKFSFPFPLFPLFSELCVPTPLPRRFKW